MRPRSQPLVCFALFALTFALVGCGGASGTPHHEATRTRVFTSHRYPYSVEVPAGWLTPDRFAEETKGEWRGALYPLDPGVDTFSDAGAQVRLSVAARRVRSGTALQEWASLIANGVPALCGRGETHRETEVGAEKADVLSYHCNDGYYVITAVALHDGRGFAIGWASPEGSEKKDRALFQRLLRSLAFTD